MHADTMTDVVLMRERNTEVAKASYESDTTLLRGLNPEAVA